MENGIERPDESSVGCVEAMERYQALLDDNSQRQTALRQKDRWFGTLRLILFLAFLSLFAISSLWNDLPVASWLAWGSLWARWLARFGASWHAFLKLFWILDLSFRHALGSFYIPKATVLDVCSIRLLVSAQSQVRWLIGSLRVALARISKLLASFSITAGFKTLSSFLFRFISQACRILLFHCAVHAQTKISR